jgi:hypothetical protein
MLSRMLGIEAKTTRAKDHLDRLEAEISAWAKEPHTVVRKDKANQHRHLIRFEVKPLPTSIPIILGEFAYNLRSGLDQLAWQLARINGSRVPRSATSFPIFSTPRPFNDKTRDILPAAVTVIESLQPYQRGNAFKDHPLWIINELCNLDKHSIFAVQSTLGKINIRGADIISRRDFEYATEIPISLSDKFNVKLEPEATEVVFGEPVSIRGRRFEVRGGDLHAAHVFVRDEVIPRFTGFFK